MNIDCISHLYKHGINIGKSEYNQRAQAFKMWIEYSKSLIDQEIHGIDFYLLHISIWIITLNELSYLPERSLTLISSIKFLRRGNGGKTTQNKNVNGTFWKIWLPMSYKSTIAKINLKNLHSWSLLQHVPLLIPMNIQRRWKSMKRWKSLFFAVLQRNHQQPKTAAK